ncbi:MAG: CHRD domain-containing protein [Pirellulales bacterium]|nr:CHRD domain-containing protein [Pirellulales bacterium]
MIRRFRLVALTFGMLSVAAVSNAALINYYADLKGLNEFPPNASPGTGTALVQYDNVAHTMHVQALFFGLTGTTTAAHIHSPIPAPPANPLAGVATQVPSFAGFPLGVNSGFFDNTFDLTLASSWNPSYIANNGGTPGTAETAFFSQVSAGKAYLNIHTTTFPGGEIRGFFVPEPSAIALIGAGIVGLIVCRRASRCKL